jgi:major membrane immunogen (membrane-anchored lipoprotein)
MENYFMAHILRRGTIMKNLKVLALVMTLVFTIGAFTACASKTEPAVAPEPAPVAEPAPAPAPAPEATVLKDGVYKATQDKADNYGWKGFVEIEVKDGKIATVKFDYENKDGALKSKDEAYKASMEPVSKTYPEKAFAELQASLVEKQDVTAVIAVSGATTSSNDFLTLAKQALEQAK